MAGNSIGKQFCLTTFGESHGAGIGGVIDGCPPGIEMDYDLLNNQMARRRPGQSSVASPRKEGDHVEMLSGLTGGTTTGAPLAFMIPNQDARSKDYNHLKDVYRPSHADYTYAKKYGIREHRGGGRSSARETAARVVGGTIGLFVLRHFTDIKIKAYVSSIGKVQLKNAPSEAALQSIENYSTRCPDETVAKEMENQILEAKEEGDSLGGVITCVVENMPIGLGEPVFDRLEADLAHAMLSINATKGFDIGSGFQGASMKGSEHNDPLSREDDQIVTETNNAGGVQGGISNGMPLEFRVAFKPVSTISKKQKTLDEEGRETELEAKGRHDPCVVPRAVPIVESMAALILTDHFLRNRVYEG